MENALAYYIHMYSAGVADVNSEVVGLNPGGVS
jgi:hypothetical protein